MKFDAAWLGFVRNYLYEPDSWWKLASKVANVVRAHGREMFRHLLGGTVLPALPVTACTLAVTALAEGQRTGNGVEVLGNIVVIFLLLPLVVGGGFWIAGAWTRTVQAAQHAGKAAGTGQEVIPVRPVWLAYLGGVVVLLAAAAAVPYVISDNAAPIDLGNIPVAGFVLAFAGPLGFLSPIALLALRTAGRCFRPAGRSSRAPAWLTAAAVLAIGYSLLVGLLMYELTGMLMADGFVALTAVLADLLTFPLPVLLISVGVAAWPVRPECPASEPS